MLGSIEIKSLSIALPKVVRANNYWREKYPEIVNTAEGRALSRLWVDENKQDNVSRSAFQIEMERYLSDPFRGAIERRVVAPDESALTLEIAAAKDALAAAHLMPSEVDLMIVCSFLSNQPAVGNALYLAKALGIKGAAWNLETACAGSLVALESAYALICARGYKNALIVVSTVYSRMVDEADTMSWSLGDGASAFVVGPTIVGNGILGVKTVHTADTCNMFVVDVVNGPEKPVYRGYMPDSRQSSRMARESSEKYLRICVEGALNDAGIELNDVKLFVFNTPSAWYGSFIGRVFGLDDSRWISKHSSYGNAGVASLPMNLCHAVKEGRIRSGDVIVLYAIGSTSSASAIVMRWGNATLAPWPGSE